MDADERLREFGPDGLRGRGEVVARPDGVALLTKVVDELDGIDEDASQTERQAPLIKLYNDPGRWNAIVASAVDRRTEVEAQILRLGAILTGAIADNVRRRLNDDRKAQLAKAVIHIAGDGEERPEVRIALDWAEYPRGVRVPEGWRLTKQALQRVRMVRDRTVHEDVGVPIVVTRQLMDADDKTWSVELAWPRGDRWMTKIVPRSIALSSRLLVALADDGLPVSSANTKRLVEWLTVLDQDPALPTDYSAARMGWVGSKTRYYLHGDRCIHKGDEPEHRVSFASSSAAAQQFARALRPGGTWDGWLGVCDVIAGQPAPWVAIRAAAAAPLLRLFKTQPFGIDFTGGSGSGKSTNLELSASCIGEPKKGRAFQGWDGTVAGTEAGVGVRCDMVLCLDEGQLVAPHRQADAGTLLYAITSGAGRAKGAIGRMGGAFIDQWLPVLISTSETGITNWSPHDGVRRRVIELRDAGIETAEQSDEVRSIIGEHYGHLYPRLLQHLVETTEDERRILKEGWAERVAWYRSQSTSSIGRSAALYCATMDAAALIMHSRLGVPEPSVDVSAWLWQQVQDVAGESDRAKRAWDEAWSYVWSNRQKFAGQGDHEPSNGGWAGVWTDDDVVGVRPGRLREVLEKARLGNVESIYREWARRGWIRTDAGRTRTRMYEPVDANALYKKRNRPWVVALIAEKADDDSEDGPF